MTTDVTDKAPVSYHRAKVPIGMEALTEVVMQLAEKVTGVLQTLQKVADSTVGTSHNVQSLGQHVLTTDADMTALIANCTLQAKNFTVLQQQVAHMGEALKQTLERSLPTPCDSNHHLAIVKLQERAYNLEKLNDQHAAILNLRAARDLQDRLQDRVYNLEKLNAQCGGDP